MMRFVFPAISLCLLGCTGDDVIYEPSDASKADSTTDVTVQPDGGAEGGSQDAQSDAPPRLLMTQIAGNTGELAVFNLGSNKVDGNLTYTGFGTTQGTTAGPFLIQSGSDVVARLDPNSPWNIASTWNVAMNDAFDGGEPYADPVQIVVVAPNKAYVLRYNRNKIAIIDPTQVADGGAPTGSIDLQSLLQADDKDGHVDMSGAIYDPVRKRLYVALANIDLGRVDPMGFFQICSQTVSTLVAIDTMTDKLVNIGGGPGNSVTLNGRSPQIGIFGGVVFDAAGDRVLVMSTGCNDKYQDGGASPLKGRVIEAVSLSSNTTQTLLDANAQDFPGQLLFLAPNKAIVQFGFGAFAKAYLWDPTMTTLGPALGTAPELFAYDGKGSLLGPRTVSMGDAGKTVEVIKVSTSSADAGASVLGTNPFTKQGSFFGNVSTWP